MDSMKKYFGIYPTMITPYNEDGTVNYESVRKLVRWYRDKGCDGIFSACQSSEIINLTLEEKYNIVKTVIEERDRIVSEGGRRMVIVASGHTSDSFSEQKEELTLISSLRPDALILITNRFDIENTEDERWIKDADRIISCIDESVSLGMYENPAPYKRLLTDKMIEWAIKTNRFTFIKDTCCDLKTLERRANQTEFSSVCMFNANAQTLSESYKYGYCGYSGIMGNIYPDIFVKLMHDLSEGRENTDLQNFVGCCDDFACLGYPSAAKYYLNKYEGIEMTSYSRANPDFRISDYVKLRIGQYHGIIEKVRKSM